MNSELLNLAVVYAVFFSIHCSQPFGNAEGVYEPKVSWILTDTRASRDGMWVMLRKTFENGEEILHGGTKLMAVMEDIGNLFSLFPIAFLKKIQYREAGRKGYPNAF